ncbi:sensor histidine kinase [Streptomyces sp. NPDC085929]|uniref:sensor histidine kinase n=1 Tax=Streptomyces sp. NPDC085929 TaxID=3365739 RepID=UPI0037CEA4DD
MTAAARLRRLRWRLTALCALTSAIGLIGVAAFAVHGDDAAWHRQLDNALNLQTSRAVFLLSLDEDARIDVQRLLGSRDVDCPPLTVLSGAAGQLTIIQAPDQPCVQVRIQDLHAVATTAIQQESIVRVDALSEDGHPLRLLAEPFAGPGTETPRGAIVAAADTSSDKAEHRRLAIRLLVGCAVLISLSAAVGHFLSGRALHLAVTALRRQERFLAEAAHDLRAPAASLRILAETALREDAQRTQALERTVRLATRMGDLLDDLLTRARLTAGMGTLARQPMRLDQLVDVVIADAHTDGHHVVVRVEPAVVLADPDLLRRAVANLFANALTHGRAPGWPAEVVLTVTADGVITIDDAGPGVPPALANSLFERFRSGSGSTGLGLSIAAWVARAHGGTLTLETSPRGGARFALRIPTCGKSTRSASNRPSSASARSADTLCRPLRRLVRIAD